MSKKSRRFVLLAAVVAAVAVVGFQIWRARQTALPKGIASGNGRIEAKLVDVAAKEPLRVKKILVDEGELVQPDEVLVQLDTSTLESQLAEAKATVATTEQKAAVNKSAIVRRKSEVKLAEIEVERRQVPLIGNTQSGRVISFPSIVCIAFTETRNDLWMRIKSLEGNCSSIALKVR